MKKKIKGIFKTQGIPLEINFKTILVVFMVFSTSSCASERKKDAPLKVTSKDSTKVISNKNQIEIFNKINFYFENSGSMNGYLEGDYFRQTIGKIIHKMDDHNLQTYFVNSEEYPASNILEKIRKNQITTRGIENSDHKFIFKNAIENSINNNLSVVVTDGIYSMNGGNLSDVEIDIQDAFEDALNNNAIETVVLKMSSNYNGTYYTESECNNVIINQERPYYILLFGNKETIDSALKNIVIIDDLEGFKEQARFFLTDNLKVDYSILTQGEEKNGTFINAGRVGGLVKEIEDVEKGKNGFLQFGIAVDFSKLSIPNQYLSEIRNYDIDVATGYIITEIIPMSNLKSNSLSQHYINTLETKKIINPTHLILVKAEMKTLGNLIIKLKNNFPDWITETGTENDCEIIDNVNQTFAFDRLMFGISKAYNTVNNKEEYFEIKLKINH